MIKQQRSCSMALVFLFSPVFLIGTGLAPHQFSQDSLLETHGLQVNEKSRLWLRKLALRAMSENQWSGSVCGLSEVRSHVLSELASVSCMFTNCPQSACGIIPTKCRIKKRHLLALCLLCIAGICLWQGRSKKSCEEFVESDREFMTKKPTPAIEYVQEPEDIYVEEEVAEEVDGPHLQDDYYDYRYLTPKKAFFWSTLLTVLKGVIEIEFPQEYYKPFPL